MKKHTVNFVDIFAWILFLVAPTVSAAPTWFVVSEVEGEVVYGDSFLLPLENLDDIQHARELIEKGPSIGSPIVLAKIARGSDGINRDVLADGKPPWSWHISGFEGFTDSTIEIYDGWPSFVEQDVEGWFQNTGGYVGFWSYTVTAEIGLHEAFLINAGLNDAWVNPDAPFQGFFITVFPDSNIVFVAMFTFDSVPPVPESQAVFGASDQRWVTGVGAIDGDSVTLAMELTSGGLFNQSDPPAEQVQNYGTLTIKFRNCNEAEASYSFPSPNLSGEMILTRAVPRDVLLCQVLTAP